MKLVFIVFIVFFVDLSLADKIEVKILHVNDGWNDDTTRTTSDLNETLKNVRQTVERVKKEGGNVLVLNTGSFTESIWSGNQTAYAGLNQIGINYSSFGHVGVSLADQVVEPLKFLVLCVNLNEKSLVNVKPSTTVKIDEMLIGIIGYYTPHQNSSDFLEESETIRKEAKRLRLLEVKTIIAFGHSGQNVEEVSGGMEEVDIFIGCHSPQKYPMWIWDGFKRVFQPLEVESGFVTKLDLVLEAQTGGVMQVKGKAEFGGKLKEKSDDPAGIEWVEPTDITLMADLEGKACKTGECNLGNFITDAVIDDSASKMNERFWVKFSVVFIHAGMILGDIKRKKLTIDDFKPVISGSPKMIYVYLRGKTLLDVITQPMRNSDSNGSDFLQYSGVRVHYDRRRREGSRVKSVLVRCCYCTMPKYEPLVEEDYYTVACPHELYDGAYGYGMIKKNEIETQEIGNLLDMIETYLKRFKRLWYVREQRIRMGGQDRLKITFYYIIISYLIH